MDLPISPSFFKKMDMYQQLRQIQEENKRLWEYEKEVLVWAVGPHHAHIGSPIGTEHVKNAIGFGIEAGRIRETQRLDAEQQSQHILDSLETRGFADKPANFFRDPKDKRVRINTLGFLAGNVLKETDFLHKDGCYKTFEILWWIVFIAGLVLLTTQTVVSICNIF